MTKQFLAAAFGAALLAAAPALAQGTNPSPTGNSSAALSGKGDIEQGNDASMLPNGGKNMKQQPTTVYSGSSSPAQPATPSGTTYTGTATGTSSGTTSSGGK